MKKIYMILAAMTLLSMSLNAQDGAKKVVDASTAKITAMTSNVKAKPYTGKNATPTLNEMLAGIKGMSSILPSTNPNESSANGQFRAPLKINTGEELVGPYTSNDFSTNGIGFPTAYGDNGQQIYLFADLDRSAFVDHDGEEIVGFRFALAGSSSDKAVLYDFHAWPYGNNGYFEAANRHTWSIPELSGAQPVNSYDDIVISTSSYYAMFTSVTVYGDNDVVLTNWNSSSTDLGTTSNGNSYYILPDGWDTGNYYMSRYSSGSNYYGYISYNGPATLTISSEYLTGQSNVRVEVSGMGYQSGATMSIGGETWNLSTSVGTHSWTIEPSGSSAPIYVELEGGQWHEYYLDEPIPFSVADSIAGMYLGYRYFQYPSTETNEFLYPIAVNPNSTVTDHVSYRYGSQGASYSDIVISPSSNQVNFYSIAVVSGNTTITSWTTSNGNTLPSGWSCSGTWNYSSSYGGYTSGTITIPASLFSSYSNVKLNISAYGDNASQSITVAGEQKAITTSQASYSWDITPTQSYTSGWWAEDFSQYGDLAVQLIFKSSLPKTATPVISVTEGDAAYTITATGNGTVTLVVDGQTYTGNGSASVTIDRGNSDQTVAVSATAQEEGKRESDPATQNVTIPALPQTAAPTIAISSQTDNQVTITATGNGTVTLTINGQTVEGNGSASITVPRQMQDYVVSATATAQEDGKLVSETTTQNLTIPGMASSGEWTEMTGTYDNPTDLLSFKVKVGADTTMVMMIDQFLAPTVYNDHPSSYTYVLKEKINGEEKSSNPATVPVYKTNSTMYSLYTEDEVLADNKYDDNKLKANVLNSEIDYDVVPDNNVLYYSLYRGGKDEPTPVVDVDHRISQLQKFEDKVGDNVTYYLTENHLSGITPRYEHIGSQIVERLDQDYVTGTETDKLSYVPVIWTFGLYTARGDGKNNSYGSDIKNSYVGKVNISVEGYKNDGNNTTGQWKDPNGTTYCVYSPKITLNGFTPEDGGANDGDTYQYVPYMYRVWCTYPNAHNFTLLANPDGKVHLADAGPITAPFLIGEATAEDSVWHNNGEEVIIGRALASGEAQQPWSFGVPVNESSSNVKFVARFYYKKIVTPAAQANGLRGNRGSERAFAIAENSADGKDIVTGINELADIVYVVSTTYVNAQGMQSDKPFDGLNIVVTRYSDGTTRTTKVVR